jgi:hypothetical protein
VTAYAWCLTHGRVESDDERCSSKDVLGPYPTRDAAEHALDKVADRNEVWDEEDRARDDEDD